MHQQKKIITIAKRLMPSSIIRYYLNKTDKKQILLTFDDGPHPDITPKVLDILDQYQARAIFFVKGCKIEQAPELLNEILARGHLLGNHTFHHSVDPRPSFSEYKNDIALAQKAIHEVTGIKPVHFRPPCGILTIPYMLAIKLSGMKIVKWSYDTGEYSYYKNEPTDVIGNFFLRAVQSRQVILSHDDNEKIPQVLEATLPRLVEMGFDLKGGVQAL